MSDFTVLPPTTYHSPSIDFHAGNIGVSLPGLNTHPPRQILDYFGNPECVIVLPITHPADPGAVPPYLVPSISLIDYLIAEDKDFCDGPLHAEIMDFGSGQCQSPHSLWIFADFLPISHHHRPADPPSLHR